MMKNLFFVSVIICAIMTYTSFAAPEPAVVQEPQQWTLDVTFEHPKLIMLQPGVDGKPRRFWYVIITLTNNTNDDVDFYPKCELMTDTFQIISAGKNVSPAVFEQIKRRHQSKYPFLESLEKAGNKILQGRDNSKDIAIIWPDFDAQAQNIQIFITGLSNETAVINHPVQKDEAGNPVKIFLRKTLELNYSLRSDPALRSDVDITYKGKRWVMR
jgi:hypothetical protein